MNRKNVIYDQELQATAISFDMYLLLVNTKNLVR